MGDSTQPPDGLPIPTEDRAAVTFPYAGAQSEIRDSIRLHRLRRVAKWTGTSICLLLAALWILSESPYTLCHFGSNSAFIVSDGAFQQPRNGMQQRAFTNAGWRLLGPGDFIPATDDTSMPIWLPLALFAIPTTLIYWAEYRRNRTSSSGV